MSGGLVSNAPLRASGGLFCVSLRLCWNTSLHQGLASRRALRHWRKPMLPWLALTYTAARLGFEAQNAAAFRLLRLGGRPETAAGKIIPHAVALPEEAPALAVAAPKRRPVAKTSKKSAP